ncbi:MAG: hypothetical protein V8T12_05555 [Parabacteroides johnsonii]
MRGFTGSCANWSDGQDPVREYLESQEVDTKDGFKQKMKYLEVNLDLMLDLY